MKDGVNLMDMPGDFWPDLVVVRGEMPHPNGKELGLQMALTGEEAANPQCLREKLNNFRLAFWMAVNTEEVGS